MTAAVVVGLVAVSVCAGLFLAFIGAASLINSRPGE
jgi:hypothetical protein